jgi:hypothetical protein
MQPRLSTLPPKGDAMAFETSAATEPTSADRRFPEIGAAVALSVIIWRNG